MKPSLFRIAQHLTLIVLGVLIYSNSLQGEFVCDDFGSILAHKDTLARFDLKELWSAYDTRIIGGISFAFNYWLGQENVIGYHVVNVVIHILNVFLIYHLVLQMLASPVMRDSSLNNIRFEAAFFSALVFLCHPLQTQAVSYIVQRYISLATFFFLSAMIAYGRARRGDGKRYYLLALLLSVVSMSTKEAVCTLPLMIIIYDTVFWGGRKHDTVRRLGILAGGITFVSLILFLAKAREEQKLFVMPDAPALPSMWHYFLTQINVLRTYLRMLILPFYQSHSYDYSIAWSITEPWTVFSVFLLGGIFAFALWSFRRGSRYLGFAIVWFFVTLSVQVVFVVLYGKSGAGFMYDHWLYLPMAGFAFFLVAGLSALFKKERARRIVLLTIITVFCVLTFQRNRVWRTEIALWENVVRNNPQTLLNHFALGRAYQNKGRDPEAKQSYVRAIKIHEGTPRAQLLPPQRVYLSRSYSNLGIITATSGNNPLAVEHFRKSLDYNKINAPAYINLGIASYQIGRYDDAADAFLRYRDFDDQNPYLYYYLGLIYQAWKKIPLADEQFRKAVRLFKEQGNNQMADQISRTLGK